MWKFCNEDGNGVQCSVNLEGSLRCVVGCLKRAGRNMNGEGTQSWRNDLKHVGDLASLAVFDLIVTILTLQSAQSMKTEDVTARRRASVMREFTRHVRV
jgi:hypothetical protein